VNITPAYNGISRQIRRKLIAVAMGVAYPRDADSWIWKQP
jgi:hypothetical protein